MRITPKIRWLLAAAVLPACALAQTPLPIVDVHLHSLTADYQGIIDRQLDEICRSDTDECHEV